MTSTIKNYKLRCKAEEIAREQNGRIGNWEGEIMTTQAVVAGSYSKISLGRYSSRCQYEHFIYSLKYCSWFEYDETTRILIYHFGFKNPETKRIRIAKGLTLSEDSLGWSCKAKDGTSVRFNGTDLCNPGYYLLNGLKKMSFSSWVKKEMSKKRIHLKELKANGQANEITLAGYATA